MQVPVDATSPDDLQLYDKADVAKRALVSIRTIEGHAKNPHCPLKWTHKAGKKQACDAATLRAFLEWLRKN